ncbi:MAG: hypothetical protein AAFX40_19390, partial [Cyanobacteria bacterium J06639_1]
MDANQFSTEFASFPRLFEGGGDLIQSSPWMDGAFSTEGSGTALNDPLSQLEGIQVEVTALSGEMLWGDRAIAAA